MIGGTLDVVDSRQEWRDFLNLSALTFGVTTRALARGKIYFSEFADKMSAKEDNHTHIAIRKPADPRMYIYAKWPSLQLPDLMSSNGVVEKSLGRQWAVNVFAFWEEVYRPRFAAEAGLSVNEVSNPIMGDLRLIRNDIVHHSSIASKQNSGRCTVLKEWIQLDNEIEINEYKILDFMMHWGLVHIGPEADEQAGLFKIDNG
jgi:hypothetical protein